MSATKDKGSQAAPDPLESLKVAVLELQGEYRIHRDAIAIVDRRVVEVEAQVEEILKKRPSSPRPEIMAEREELLADVGLGAKSKKDLYEFDARAEEARLAYAKAHKNVEDEARPFAETASALRKRQSFHETEATRLKDEHRKALIVFLQTQAESIGAEYSDRGKETLEKMNRVLAYQRFLRTAKPQERIVIHNDSFKEFCIPSSGCKPPGQGPFPLAAHLTFIITR